MHIHPHFSLVLLSFWFLNSELIQQFFQAHDRGAVRLLPVTADSKLFTIAPLRLADVTNSCNVRCAAESAFQSAWLLTNATYLTVAPRVRTGVAALQSLSGSSKQMAVTLRTSQRVTY